MKKVVGVIALVFLGLVGLSSVMDFLLLLPGRLDFFSGGISRLNHALDYEEEILLAVGALVIAAWAFDKEVDRGKEARKAVAGLTFICVLAAFALFATSIDHLGDGDSWVAIAVADNEVVAGPSSEPDKTTDKGGVDGGEAPAPGQSGEQLASGASGESDAFSSKGGSASSGGCTCPSPEKFVPSPPPQASGESEAIEGGGLDEGALEAEEEAAEERELEQEEAELAELGF